MLYPLPSQPAAPHRVVVTGVGILTALGDGWAANAAGCQNGLSAIRPVTLFDTSRQRAHQAGEVDLPPAAREPRSFRARRRVLDRATHMLLHTASQAVHQAGWRDLHHIPVVLGTTSAGLPEGEQFYRQALSEQPTFKGQAFRILQYQAQSQVLELCSALNIDAPVTLISNACASGANAIGHAWSLLRQGHTPRVLTGGYEGLCHTVFSGFDSLQALSTTSCRPFDARRNGLTLGEGAAILTLETLDHALARNAVVLGEIVGYGASTDCHHLTQPHPEGDAALGAMNAACISAHLQPYQIGYINAHGTGTPLNDSSEALAINRWAGPHAPSLNVSSTKGSIGHLLGAAGAIETVVCLMALREGWLPPNVNLQEPDPLCQFQLVRQPTRANTQFAMSNSFGFGGSNASLILRRWP